MALTIAGPTIPQRRWVDRKSPQCTLRAADLPVRAGRYLGADLARRARRLAGHLGGLAQRLEQFAIASRIRSLGLFTRRGWQPVDVGGHRDLDAAFGRRRHRLRLGVSFSRGVMQDAFVDLR